MRIAALCFKVAFDAFGALAFVRVYAGVLRKGDVVSTRSKRRLRIGRLVRLFGEKREDVETLAAGDIGALLGVELSTGESLYEPRAPIELEPIQLPQPILRIAIEPRTGADRDRLGEALRRLTLADPSLALASDEETQQTLLAGMGQLHLEIAVERLRREHGVALTVGTPRVAYRETITRSVRVDVKHSQQTGGPGQYAHVICEVAPAEPGAGLVFEDRVRGGSIPKAFIPGVRKGFEQAAQCGVLGGYAVVDVRMTLLDGSFHSNDSNEQTFLIAGRLALKQACREGGPALLEPWMRLDVRVPDDHVGDVIGDLCARRGRILAMRPGAPESVIEAEVPLAQLVGYATDLGSLARGRGTHDMKLSRYQLVPDDLLARALERG
ncbi:MAG: hypothetical protein K8H88_18695 [Sandaracinaceae bacterium]|nr:hypothetical protein [Sandaracinaceae bacterium]